MQWLRTRWAIAILPLCTALIALRTVWPPLDCWLVRGLFVVLFTDHLPEVMQDFGCSH